MNNKHKTINSHWSLHSHSRVCSRRRGRNCSSCWSMLIHWRYCICCVNCCEHHFPKGFHIHFLSNPAILGPLALVPAVTYCLPGTQRAHHFNIHPHQLKLQVEIIIKAANDTYRTLIEKQAAVTTANRPLYVCQMSYVYLLQACPVPHHA